MSESATQEDALKMREHYLRTRKHVMPTSYGLTPCDMGEDVCWSPLALNKLLEP